MEPTPYNNAIGILMADIERLGQELRALNKRPLPATEDQVKALLLTEKNRPVNVPADKVVEQLMGRTGEHVSSFQAIYNQFISLLESRTRALSQELATQVAAIQKATAAMQQGTAAMAATAERFPHKVAIEGDFHGFSSWKVAAALIGLTILLLVIGMGMGGQFSKVSRADFDRLQARNDSIRIKNASTRKTNELLNEENLFYLRNIKRYVAKNKKSAAAFPEYKRID
ncbi:MAG: hypothetical protein EOO37_03940 [Cytophagaceae bacterium]|nr:MAG: hypothetical protein EOO37_03940 [Cytophagaceae bacterium]